MAEKDVIRTDRAPGPFQGAPYNQAIRVGDLVFVAGQLGISLETGALAGAGVAEQTEQIMANLGAILEAAGSGLDRLVKTTVFLMDLGDFAAMNDVYAKHVGDRPPARSTVQISGLAERRARRDRGDRAHLSCMTGTRECGSRSRQNEPDARARPSPAAEHGPSAIPTAECAHAGRAGHRHPREHRLRRLRSDARCAPPVPGRRRRGSPR